MDIRKAAALLLVLLALFSSLPVASQSGIIVTGADSVQDTSFTYSQDLVDTTSSAGPRVVVEYSDSTGPYNLAEMPTALQALVYTVPTMVIVEYANSTDPHALAEIPTALQALVSTVPQRVVVEYANSTHGAKLAYPLELMNDTQSPEVTGVSATDVTTDTATIAWRTTDEFADSLVQYGLQSGSYTETAQDSLYVKDHAVALSGLFTETTYYFTVSSTDQSGNPATSTEHSFTTLSPEVFVYLPLILRNH